MYILQNKKSRSIPLPPSAYWNTVFFYSPDTIPALFACNCTDDHTGKPFPPCWVSLNIGDRCIMRNAVFLKYCLPDSLHDMLHLKASESTFMHNFHLPFLKRFCNQ